MSTFEALLATVIFILLLSLLVLTLNGMVYNRFLELKQARLRAEGKTIAEVLALFLETNPRILYDEAELVRKLEDWLKTNEYIHKISLDNLVVIQTKITISFPAILVKESSDTYDVRPATGFYILTFQKGELVKLERVSGPVHLTGEGGHVIATPGSLYVNGFRRDASVLTYKIGERPCILVHFEGNKPCKSKIQKVTGSEAVSFSSDCFPIVPRKISPSTDGAIFNADKIEDAISWLIDNGLINKPFAVICDDKYYVQPPLDAPVVLFNKEVPRGVSWERAYATAVVDGCLLLIEVMVWD